ncbi:MULTISPECIES: hypothetical protein [Legionella]|uniref:Uncharacterized protein n=1 Tax=Legionella maceachernii TaxID=466 RepID=A0A0W0W5A7_9GAMM|nr:hypothetical protein [Legionella maceachernii]KTD27062.1 hypothetical protein Lmac_1310 [Legionella maceachernii]SKA04286.1 hypothetical protein SAMN02745128_01868 [Legionella maceachernii]SUP00254.1 Uncharacterised protein [Legionella maceachernii]
MQLVIQFRAFSTQNLSVGKMIQMGSERLAQIKGEIREALTEHYQEYEETYDQMYGQTSINLFVTEVDESKTDWLVFFREQNDIEKLASINKKSKEVKMTTYENSNTEEYQCESLFTESPLF